jgi:(hydroxyamino)benzene mutase
MQGRTAPVQTSRFRARALPVIPGNMNVSCFKARHGRRLVQAGAMLLLLSVLLGFIVPGFALPRVAVSAHLVGLLQGLLLLTTGQLWGRLRLTRLLSSAASGLSIGGAYGAWSANVLAAAWGAGGELLRQAASGARGTEFQELALTILLRGSGVAIAISWALISFGLGPYGNERAPSHVAPNVAPPNLAPR